MKRKVAPTATVAGRVSTTRSARILASIKDQKRSDIGRYAGWGSEEDAHAPAGKGERLGPALAPFLRHRASDRWWKVGVGFVYVPAIIVVITVEHWLHVDQSLVWISLGVFYAAFLGSVYLIDRSIDRR